MATNLIKSGSRELANERKLIREIINLVRSQFEVPLLWKKG